MTFIKHISQTWGNVSLHVGLHVTKETHKQLRKTAWEIYNNKRSDSVNIARSSIFWNKFLKVIKLLTCYYSHLAEIALESTLVVQIM